MGIPNERLTQFQTFEGVDLNVDSRTTNPNAWKETKNLFGKTPGRLEKRPGSSVFSSGLLWNDGAGGIGGTPTATGVNKLFIGAPPGLPVEPTRPGRNIVGLHSFVASDLEKDLLIGAFSFTAQRPPFLPGKPTLHDALFFVDAADKMIVMKTTDNLFEGGGNVWSFLQYGIEYDQGPQTGVDTAITFYLFHNPVKDASTPLALLPLIGDVPEQFLGFTTDGEGYLSILLKVIGKQETTAHRAVVKIFTDNIATSLSGPQPKLRLIKKVRALVEYRGAPVLGGFQLQEYDNTATDGLGALDDDFSHFVSFMDQDLHLGTALVGLILIATHQMGPAANLKIGANKNDPVTALGIVTAETDDVGFKEQLAIFTGREVRVFDGDPPTLLNPVSPNGLFNTLNKSVGTLAKNSVITTPKGLIFLGSDGLIYLIRHAGATDIVPIGNAIEPRLNKIALSQHVYASAVYDKGFYKLSLPAGNALAPSEEWWADIRNLNPQDKDFGVRWYGPMERQGVALQVFTTRKGTGDALEVIAGGSKQPKLFDLSDEALFTDGTGQDIDIRAESPDMDPGDAHKDKQFIRTELGITTGKTTTVDETITAFATAGCVSAAKNFSNSVDPCGNTWGSFNFGATTFWESLNNFTLVENRPDSRLRGRVFKWTIEESGSGSLAISDGTVGLAPISRRG